MLRTHEKPAVVSANPLALATLTTVAGVLVEWTSVHRVRWMSNGRQYVRHVLDPILEEHVGRFRGLCIDLLLFDVGCRLIVDVPVERLTGEVEYDLHVEDGR